MSRLFLAANLVLVCASLALAQEPRPQTEFDNSGISPGEINKTPEMWFYEQSLRQNNNPRVAVRAKAEFRADQRRRRMAALSWFGFSNARPTVTFTPTMSPFSPTWAGNHYQPEHWRGTGSPTYVVTVPRGDVR